ncbi:conserved protein of unknown function [Tenacibaculum sp. 190524A02b]|uniref:hypothetical protein n=1 Tax=Tenacibaculum vairaonense TaxID=3137860 RepID=UPI0032B11397
MRKFPLTIIIILFFNLIAKAQVDEMSLMGVAKATTTELNNISSPEIGSLAFDTVKDRLVEYTSSGWREMLTDQNVYVSFFIINAPGGTTATSFNHIENMLPFQPSQITFKAHANIEAFNINSAGSAGLNTATLQNAFGTTHGFARQDTSSITQATIYIGGSGSSINSISRYSSNTQCIGLRYGNQNAQNLGTITASLSTFDSNGFTLNVSYGLGSSGNTNRDNDILNESLVVLYTAYK